MKLWCSTQPDNWASEIYFLLVVIHLKCVALQFYLNQKSWYLSTCQDRLSLPRMFKVDLPHLTKSILRLLCHSWSWRGRWRAPPVSVQVSRVPQLTCIWMSGASGLGKLPVQVCKAVMRRAVWDKWNIWLNFGIVQIPRPLPFPLESHRSKSKSRCSGYWFEKIGQMTAKPKFYLMTCIWVDTWWQASVEHLSFGNLTP